MSLASDIKTILASSSSLTAVVAARIYPVVVPEKPTLPCVAYTLDGIDTGEHKGSAMGWDNCSVTVTVIASKFEDAELYGNYIRTVMNRYKATISSDVVKGCKLQTMSWEAVPLTESGSPTGVMAFAVVSTWQLMVAQNISE